MSAEAESGCVLFVGEDPNCVVSADEAELVVLVALAAVDIELVTSADVDPDLEPPPPVEVFPLAFLVPWR